MECSGQGGQVSGQCAVIGKTHLSWKEILIPHIAIPRGYLVMRPATDQREGTSTSNPQMDHYLDFPKPTHPTPHALSHLDPGWRWSLKTEVFPKAGCSPRGPGDAACCCSKTVLASGLVGPEFMSKASVTNQPGDPSNLLLLPDPEFRPL